MSDTIQHLAGITATTVLTARGRVHALTRGPQAGQPVLFLHGNLASSTFWEETLLALPDRFLGVACDLRGYGQSDPQLRIDATRGVADWADDAVALADACGWDCFHLVAHSLGGCVAWALIALVAERLLSVTLFAPGPPCGFGGAHGERGTLNYEDGAGSGAGLVHPRLVEYIAAGDRGALSDLFSPRGVMNRLYWKPPFRPAREEALLTAMLQVHRGEDRFPGDWRPSPHWPGFAPGRFGPINALATRHNEWVLPKLIAAADKPPLLWIYGADDPIVRDESLSDIGMQGKLGIRGDWPGEAIFPPQPLLAQVKYALDEYERSGGSVERLILPGVGHTPYLEQPAAVQAALADHLAANRR